MNGSWVHAVNIVLCTACIGLGGGAYAGLLPPRVGVLPIFALVAVAGCYGGAWWMKHSPSSLNMPNQDTYDTLPEEAQQNVIACILPFMYGCVTLWTGFGILSVLAPKTEFLVIVLVLAGIMEGAMAVHFLLLKAPQKVRELQEASQDKSQ